MRQKKRELHELPYTETVKSGTMTLASDWCSYGEDRVSMDSLKSSVRVAQTQTEKSISLLTQFLFCLFANVDYR